MSANRIFYLALFGSWLLGASEAPGQNVRKIDALKSMDELDDSKQLQPESLISIRILEDKHGATQQIVDSSGEIRAPYVGTLKAEKMTCRELALKIKAELEKNFFARATVLVAVDGFERPVIRTSCPVELPFVVLFGAAARQGKFDLAGIPGQRLSGLLRQAGGLTSKSATPEIRIIRRTPKGNKTILVNTAAILAEKRAEYDLYLRRDDVVLVE